MTTTETPKKKRGGVRPGAGRPVTTVLTSRIDVRCSPETEAKLGRVADDQGTTPGQLVRKWVEAKLRRA